MYVCVRVRVCEEAVMSLCIIFKTWIETFAYSDVAKKSYKNPGEPRHYCQSGSVLFSDEVYQG